MDPPGESSSVIPAVSRATALPPHVKRVQRCHGAIRDDIVAEVLAAALLDESSKKEALGSGGDTEVELCLNFNQLSDVGCAALADFLLQHRRPVHVVSLEILGNRLTDGCVPHLCRLLIGMCSPSPEQQDGAAFAIQRLKLGDNMISTKGIMTFCQTLERHPAAIHALRQLHLGGNPIGDEGVKALEAVLSRHCHRLDVLCLRDVGSTAASTDCIARILQHCTQLTTIQLRSNPVDRDGALALGGALRISALTILSLQNAQIDFETCATLCQFLDDFAVHSLTALDIANNPIGDAGAMALCRIMKKTHLTSLLLMRTGITKVGVSCIASEIADQQRRQLERALSEGHVTTETSESLPPAASRRAPWWHVSMVDLSHNRLPDAGPVIADIIRCTYPTTVTRANPFPSAAAAEPSGRQSQTTSAALIVLGVRITTLRLHECHISTEGTAAICQALLQGPATPPEGANVWSPYPPPSRDGRRSTLAEAHDDADIDLPDGLAAGETPNQPQASWLVAVDYSSNYSNGLPRYGDWAAVVRRNTFLRRLVVTNNEMDLDETSALMTAVQQVVEARKHRLAGDGVPAPAGVTSLSRLHSLPCEGQSLVSPKANKMLPRDPNRTLMKAMLSDRPLTGRHEHHNGDAAGATGAASAPPRRPTGGATQPGRTLVRAAASRSSGHSTGGSFTLGAQQRAPLLQPSTTVMLASSLWSTAQPQMIYHVPPMSFAPHDVYAGAYPAAPPQPHQPSMHYASFAPPPGPAPPGAAVMAPMLQHHPASVHGIMMYPSHAAHGNVMYYVPAAHHYSAPSAHSHHTQHFGSSHPPSV